ncbi:MAG TPA: PAS domain S-box protein, partial [Candidatus Desulfofervidus auxilii]|nr:PAS domain S-box protein [Candidatus Desulfofervidus auxilii]
VSSLCYEILDCLVRLLGFDLGIIRIFDTETKTLNPIAVIGFPEKGIREKLSVLHFNDERHVAALVAHTKVPIFAPNVKRHKIPHTYAQKLDEFDIHSLIVWPLIGKEKKFWGTIELIGYVPKDINKKDYPFFETMANMFSIAIEHKRMEERLLAEKERLIITLRSIGDGVIVTDNNGKIILMNQKAEELTGWVQDEAKGRPLEEVFYIVNEKTYKRCKNPFERVIKTDGIVGLANDTILIAKDGTQRVITDSGVPIRDKLGGIVGVVVVFRDITEKRKMKEELAKADKLESLSVLASGIAHDFNNILTAVLGNIALAKMAARPIDEVIKRLEKAEKACFRGRKLTQQLLTFARGGEPVKKIVSIADLVKESANLALSGSNVKIKFFIKKDLWPVEVDEGQMSQVIHNMIINAEQAMPKGGVIKIICENVIVTDRDSLPLKEGKYVRIAIQDQGVGISKEFLSKIFDPFFTTKSKGSGLGLAIAYSVIKKHKGFITVDSKLGVGTTFHIYLPAAKGEITTSEEDDEKIKGKGKVLVMDDEEMILEITEEMLKQLGYEVVCTKNGEEAIKLYEEAKISKRPFDAVILDLTIPGGMGGEEVIKKLIHIDPQVKAIVSSGYPTAPIIADYKKYGFCATLIKPYRMNDLAKILHNIIKKK